MERNIGTRTWPWLLLLALAFGGQGCSDKITPPTTGGTLDDSAVPESLRAAYRTDAAQLAYRDIIQPAAVTLNDIELPRELVDTYYRDLVRVYKAYPMAAPFARTHTWPSPMLDAIAVSADSTAPWIAPLRAGTWPTGNTILDTLAKRFGLRIDFYFTFPPRTAILRVVSSRPLNPKALVQVWNSDRALGYAELDAMVGGGNDVRASRVGSRIRLDYIVACHDCPMGCMDRDHWYFDIDPDGGVEFEGRSGMHCADGGWSPGRDLGRASWFERVAARLAAAARWTRQGR